MSERELGREHIDTRVREIEREIDTFFENESRTGGIYRPALTTTLIDLAETVISVNRYEEEGQWPAFRILLINVAEMLSWALRIVSVQPSQRRRVTDDTLALKARHLLELGRCYSFAADAFFWYWKGHASVEFPQENEIRFIPKETEFGVRLREYESHDGLQSNHRGLPSHPLLSDKSLIDELVRALALRSRKRRIGGPRYRISPRILTALIDNGYQRMITEIPAGVPSIRLKGFTFEDLLRGFSLVHALSEIHLIAFEVLVKSRIANDSAACRSLVRERSEWESWFKQAGIPEAVLDALCFDYLDKNATVLITPLVPIDTESFAIAPSIASGASISRNAFGLIARREQATYSAFAASREEQFLHQFRDWFPEIVTGTRVTLPHQDGRQLPDIDLLLRQQGREFAVIAEVKWQLGPSDHREAIARTEYLRTGGQQLERIRSFLRGHPSYLRNRGLVEFETTDRNTVYLLLGKGHLGGKELVAQFLLADYDIFVKFLRDTDLEGSVERLRRYDYLPVRGRDFDFKEVAVQVGRWHVLWQGRTSGTQNMHPAG